MTLFDFLEQYMKRLEGPLALQVWNRFLQLAKDLLVTMRDFRPQAFAALKYVLPRPCQSQSRSTVFPGVSPFWRIKFLRQQH